MLWRTIKGATILELGRYARSEPRENKVAKTAYTYAQFKALRLKRPLTSREAKEIVESAMRTIGVQK